MPMGGSYMNDRPDQVREEACSVLADMRQWEISPARWEEIAAILSDLALGLAQNDLDAVAAATIQMELAGPVRLIKIGAQAQPPPTPVRERINRLIDQLSGESKDSKDPKNPKDDT